MPLTQFQVFSQYAYTAFIELLAQNVALFNAASRGGIVLRSAANQGDFADEVFYARIAGLIRRRDAYGDTDVAEKDIEQLLKTTVKVAAGTPPVRIDPHMWQWIQRSPEEAGVVIGKQLAEETMQDMLNTGIRAFVSAISNVGATVVYDAAAATANLRALNKGAALFGDRAQAIVAWVMHSKVLHDIFDTSLANSEQLFNFGNVQVISDGFGRPFIVTDCADLFNATPNPDEYRTLGLVPGAILLEQNNDFLENLETKNGGENIRRTWQAQWSYNLGIKGFSWDKANGGASPTNAALATGSNWDRNATSVKDLAGVIVETQ